MNRYKELVESWREGAVSSEPHNRTAAPKPAPVPEEAHEAMREASLTDALVTSMLDSSQPMYVCDKVGALVFANAPYRNLLSLAAHRSNGHKSTLAYHEALHPLVAEAGDPIERDETVTIGNTTQRYRARHVALLDADGDFAGSYGVFSDVTHLYTSRRQTVRAIEHSDLLIRSIADWTWETDAELAVVTISRGISAITGLPPKLLSGLSLLDLGSFDEPETGGPTPEEILRRRTPFRNMRYRMTDTEGRERHFHLSGMPVFADEGRQFSGYHGTATEITAQIEAEADAAASRRDVDQAMRALVERNKELGAANESAIAAAQSKNKFLAMMSHELRTPLNAIIGFSEIASKQMFGPLSDPYLGYSHDVLLAAQHLLGVINDVLDVAKIESDVMTVMVEPVSLHAVLDDARSFVTLQSEQKSINISEVATDSDAVVLADPVRLRQVMINLLGNAVKFTDAGGRVGVDVETRISGMADITVWDTGIGIAPEMQEKVFESFQQIGQNIEYRPHEGTGLGLTISRHLVQLMGGEISLESEPNEGSRFTVHLPLGAPDKNTAGKAPDTTE